MSYLKSDRSKSNTAPRRARQPSGTFRGHSNPSSVGGSSIDELADEANRPKLGLEGVREIRIHLVKLFGHIERCHEKVHEAFGGQPFLPDLPPDCPANRRRFSVYLEQTSALTNLAHYVLDLWMISCGLKPEDDWVPLLIVETTLRARERDPKPIQAEGYLHAPERKRTGAGRWLAVDRKSG